jgi:hypothetical protein
MYILLALLLLAVCVVSSSSQGVVNIANERGWKSLLKLRGEGNLLVLFYSSGTGTRNAQKMDSRQIEMLEARGAETLESFSDACKDLGAAVQCAKVDYDLVSPLAKSVLVESGFAAQNVRRFGTRVHLWVGGAAQLEFKCGTTHASILWYVERWLSPGAVRVVASKLELMGLLETECPLVMALWGDAFREQFAPLYAFWRAVAEHAHRDVLFLEVPDASMLPGAETRRGEITEPHAVLYTEHWRARSLPAELFDAALTEAASTDDARIGRTRQWIVDRAFGFASVVTRKGFGELAARYLPVAALWIDKVSDANEPLLELAHMLSTRFGGSLSVGVMPLEHKDNIDLDESGESLPAVGPSQFGAIKSRMPMLSVLDLSRRRPRKYVYERRPLGIDALDDISAWLRDYLRGALKPTEFSQPIGADNALTGNVRHVNLAWWREHIGNAQRRRDEAQAYLAIMWNSEGELTHIGDIMKPLNSAASLGEGIEDLQFIAYDWARNDLPADVEPPRGLVEPVLYIGGESPVELAVPVEWQRKWTPKELFSWIMFRLAEYSHLNIEHADEAQAQVDFDDIDLQQ